MAGFGVTTEGTGKNQESDFITRAPFSRLVLKVMSVKLNGNSMRQPKMRFSDLTLVSSRLRYPLRLIALDHQENPLAS
jgi:hypothetical protein